MKNGLREKEDVARLLRHSTRRLSRYHRLWVLRGDDAPGAVRAGEEQGDAAGPSGLVRGTQPAAGFAVEVLVEQQVVAELGVGLGQCVVAQRRAAAVRAA